MLILAEYPPFTSAVLYSIVATAQANGLNTEQYLTELFSHHAGMLIVAYEAVHNEIEMKRTFPSWDYLEEYYKTAGIGVIYEKRKLIKEYKKTALK